MYRLFLACRDCPKACASQHAVLELACAVVQALQGDIDQKWEGLASMEKVNFSAYKLLFAKSELRSACNWLYPGFVSESSRPRFS